MLIKLMLMFIAKQYHAGIISVLFDLSYKPIRLVRFTAERVYPGHMTKYIFTIHAIQRVGFPDHGAVRFGAT